MDKKTEERFQRIEKDLAETGKLTQQNSRDIQKLNRLAKVFLKGMSDLSETQAETAREVQELSRTVDRFIRYRNGREKN